jgi:hypothetical protein
MTSLCSLWRHGLSSLKKAKYQDDKYSPWHSVKCLDRMNFPVLLPPPCRMWSRSRRLGLETISRRTRGLVSVSSRTTWPTSRSRFRSRDWTSRSRSRLLGSRAQVIISATIKQQQYCEKQNECIIHYSACCQGTSYSFEDNAQVISCKYWPIYS